MSEFIKVTFKPDVVNYFARNLGNALREKGWKEKDIRGIPSERALAFLIQPDQSGLKQEAETLSANPNLLASGQEAFTLTNRVPTFFLVEQVCKALGSSKANKTQELVEELELQHV